MSTSKKYIVKKDENDSSVTYMEYEKREGLKMTPKNKISFEDMINVNEIVIINSSLIKKLITKKYNKNLKRILDMSMIVQDEDDDTGNAVILGEIERLENLLINKYQKYLEDQEYDIMLKKLEMIKMEIEARTRKNLDVYYESKSKSSR